MCHEAKSRTKPVSIEELAKGNWRRNVACFAIAVGAVSPFFRAPQTSGSLTTLRIEADAVSATDAMELSAREFTRETGIKIIVDKLGYESSMAKATEDLTSRSGKYDILLQNADALAKFATQGSIFTVDELEHASGTRADFEGDLFTSAWRALSWYKGERYGYPLAANTMLVVYRKDLLENAAEQQGFRARYHYDLGPPQNWNQYKDLAEYFTRPQSGLYGTLLQGKRFPAVWFEWLNFAFSFGGGAMEKEHSWEYGPIIINSPNTVRATEYYNSLKEFSPPGFTGFTWNDAIEQMRDGHVFMCIVWSDALFHILDPKLSKVIGKVGFAPIPAGNAGRVSQIAGSSYFVSRYSKHPIESFRFELWMLNRQNQINQELAQGSSARRSVYQDAKVLQLPYVPAMTQCLSVARGMADTIPETPQVSDIIEAAISDVLSDRKKPQQALDWAAAEIHKTLGEKSSLKFPVPADE